MKEKSTAKNSRLISASVAYDGTKSAQSKEKSTQTKDNTVLAKDKSTQAKEKFVQAKDKPTNGQEKVQVKEKSAKSQREDAARAPKKKIVMRPGDPGMTAPIKIN